METPPSSSSKTPVLPPTSAKNERQQREKDVSNLVESMRRKASETGSLAEENKPTVPVDPSLTLPSEETLAPKTPHCSKSRTKQTSLQKFLNKPMHREKETKAETASVMAEPETLNLSSEEKELQKNTVTEVLVKGRFERADNCEFRCPCECCDSITHTTAQLKKHLKGCKYNLDPSAQPTFEIECFKCEETIYSGELKRLKTHAKKCVQTLAIHETIHMPSCLTCNRFFFLESALLKHIKLEHAPTAPQAIEDKSRTIILNCGTYSEAGETLKLPCPVVGCPRNSVCYKNLRQLTEHIKKEHTKNLILSTHCSKCNINITSHNMLKSAHHFINCKGAAFPFLSAEVPSPSRIRPLRPDDQPSSTATTTTPPQAKASPTTNVITPPKPGSGLPTLRETAQDETPTPSAPQASSSQRENPVQTAEPHMEKVKGKELELKPGATSTDDSRLQEHVSQRLSCTVTTVGVKPSPNVATSSAPTWPRERRSKPGTGATKSRRTALQAWLGDTNKRGNQPSKLSPLAPCWPFGKPSGNKPEQSKRSTSVAGWPTVTERTPVEAQVPSVPKTPSPQREKLEETTEPHLCRADLRKREHDSEANRAEVVHLQEQVSQRVKCAETAVGVKSTPAVPAYSAPTWSQKMKTASAAGAKDDKQTTLQAWLKNADVGRKQTRKLSPLAPSWPWPAQGECSTLSSHQEQVERHEQEGPAETEHQRFLVGNDQSDDGEDQAGRRQAEIRDDPHRQTTAFIPGNLRDARQALRFLVKKHHAQKYTFEVFEKDFELWIDCAQEGFADKRRYNTYSKTAKKRAQFNRAYPKDLVNPRRERHRKGAEMRKAFFGNKRKSMAMKLLKGGENEIRCPISGEKLEEAFKNIYSPEIRTSERNLPPWMDNEMRPDDISATQEDQDLPINHEEIHKVIKNFNLHSAPGVDGLTNAFWRRLDWSGKLLAPLLEIVRLHKKIPSIWRTSRVTLICKDEKGDLNSVSNWRPIAVCCTLYKIYTATIANRVTKWADDNQVLSPQQKGFRPTEGVFEHQFVLEEVITAAKMQSKSFAVTWLDIRNAFGSVETVSMLQILTFFKAPKYISGVIRNIYEGRQFLVQGGDGVQASIPVTKGVRQGCPLSGVLFNLVTEPLLRGLMK